MNNGRGFPHRIWCKWCRILMAGVMMMATFGGSMALAGEKWLVGDINLNHKVDVTATKIRLHSTDAYRLTFWEFQLFSLRTPA